MKQLGLGNKYNGTVIKQVSNMIAAVSRLIDYNLINMLLS